MKIEKSTLFSYGYYLNINELLNSLSPEIKTKYNILQLKNKSEKEKGEIWRKIIKNEEELILDYSKISLPKDKAQVVH